MNLNAILLEPNTCYKAVGERKTGAGSKITYYLIRFETDVHCRVVSFTDGYTDDPSMADSWDYLQLKNTANESTLDLRLHTAAINGDVSLAQEALEEGADTSLRMKQGATALHWAAAHGNYDVARLLIEGGADINITDDLGWTPIALAVQGQHQRIALLLYERRQLSPQSFKVGRSI